MLPGSGGYGSGVIHFDNIGLKVRAPVGIEKNGPPSAIKTPVLYSNFPNPFNGNTKIQYYLPRQTEVELSVYNVLGQLVETLFWGDNRPGQHFVNWSADNMASGVYFYCLKTENTQLIKKCLLVK